MKKLFILMIIFSLPIISLLGDWTSIGPSNLRVNDYAILNDSPYFEVLCTENGIILVDGTTWYEFTYGGMPCWEAVQLDSNNILIAMGNGTFSDGIYKFDLTTHQFEVQEWALKPHFLIYCLTLNAYYAGSQTGLLYSNNGFDWTFVATFYNENCIAMAYCNNHLILSTMAPDSSSHSIYFSNDAGVTWNDASIGAPWICDFYFMEDETLYGVFPDHSWSSGLWKSTDYGYTWGVEFWSTGMSSVYFNSYLYVGWSENLGGDEGVAIWDFNSSNLIFLNEGLHNFTIHNLSHNDLIFCVNVVACTDSGAYINYDPVVDLDDNNIIETNFTLSQNYPNPLNPSTKIRYSIPNTSKVLIKIYDILGNEIETLVDEQKPVGSYEIEFDATALPSGIYFYRLQAGPFVETKKMILLK